MIEDKKLQSNQQSSLLLPQSLHHLPDPSRSGSSPKILGGGDCPISPFITEKSILYVLQHRKNTNSIYELFFQLAFESGEGGQQVPPSPNAELPLIPTSN